MGKTYFVHTLNQAAWHSLKRHGIRKGARICYVLKNVQPSLERRLSEEYLLEYVNFHLLEPQAYIDSLAEAIVIIRRIMALDSMQGVLLKATGYFDVENSYVAAGFEMRITRFVTEDCKMLFLAERLHAEGEKICLLEHVFLFRGIPLPLPIVGISSPISNICGFIRMVAEMMYCTFVWFFKGGPDGWRDAPKGGVIFEQMYPFIVGDPEFLPLYEYFRKRDDVVYLLPDSRQKSEKLAYIRGHNKYGNVYMGGASAFGTKVKVAGEMACYSLFVAFLRLPVYLKIGLLRMKFAHLRYRLLLLALRPKFYLMQRGDMISNHPLVTGLMNKYGGKNVGYMCGSYCYVATHVYNINFHYYGLLGPDFMRKIYKEYWTEDKAKYFVAGPLTLANRDNNAIPERGKVSVSIFLTSVTDDIHMPFNFYKDMLNSCYATIAICRQTLGLEIDVFLKAKSYEKMVAEYEMECARAHGIYAVKYSCHQGKEDYPVPAEDLLLRSDVIVVMGSSTVAWEALHYKKRMIVFQPRGVWHPFEDDAPMIVARTAEEFQERFSRVVQMSEKDYLKMIEPVLAKWSLNIDSNVAENFWSQIENAAAEKE